LSRSGGLLAQREEERLPNRDAPLLPAVDLNFLDFIIGIGIAFVPAMILGVKRATGSATGKCFVATAASFGARWDNVFFDTIFGLNPFFLTFTTWTLLDGLVKLNWAPPHTGPPLRWIFESFARTARFGVGIGSLVLLFV
jgi:hypothetical protein